MNFFKTTLNYLLTLDDLDTQDKLWIMGGKVMLTIFSWVFLVLTLNGIYFETVLIIGALLAFLSFMWFKYFLRIDQQLLKSYRTYIVYLTLHTFILLIILYSQLDIHTKYGV